MANDCQQQIRLLELYRTGEMEHKCLTRDEFLSLLSESALPFRLVVGGMEGELNQSRHFSISFILFKILFVLLFICPNNKHEAWPVRVRTRQDNTLLSSLQTQLN